MKIVTRKLKIGLLINPYAGIGGEAALKGSDGESIRQQALEYSDTLRSLGRADRFLRALSDARDSIEWVVPEGSMGQDALAPFSLKHVEVILTGKTDGTEAKDSRLFVETIKEQVDLLVFVGGDGTARDVLTACGELLCLGIPAGVKMQSSVFAITPEAGASIVQVLLAAGTIQSQEGEVRDIDEEALRQGKVRSKYFGSMTIVDEPRYLQRLKMGATEDEQLVLDDMSEYLTELFSEKKVLVGPGKTTAYWLESLGVESTLVGFDFIDSGKLVQSDLNGQDIELLLSKYTDMDLLISPTGHQGVLIGRGNQQLTAKSLKTLPKKHWHIVASKSKLNALEGRPLIVDSNDVELDQQLCGLYPVICAYEDEVLYPVNMSYENNV
jgi:predicted polyphosphate/ATP-dependent NAD kinase